MISLIAAMGKNRAIGNQGQLPWNQPEDLKFFKEKTIHHIIVMGRKTFDSIGCKPLPKRTNIVITRQKDLKGNGADVVSSVEEAVALAKSKHGYQQSDELFIVGGAEIYKAALPIADRIYLTEIDTSPEGDAFFPEFESAEWKVTEERIYEKDEKNSHRMRFLTYQRSK